MRKRSCATLENEDEKTARTGKSLPTSRNETVLHVRDGDELPVLINAHEQRTESEDVAADDELLLDVRAEPEFARSLICAPARFPQALIELFLGERSSRSVSLVAR